VDALSSLRFDFHNSLTIFKRICKDNSVAPTSPLFIKNFFQLAQDSQSSPILGINVAATEESILKGLETLYLHSESASDVIKEKRDISKAKLKFTASIRKERKKASPSPKSPYDLRRRHMEYILHEVFLQNLSKMSTGLMTTWLLAVLSHEYRMKKFKKGMHVLYTDLDLVQE